MGSENSPRDVPYQLATVVPLTAGVAAQTVDASLGNVFSLTLTVNTTLAIKNGQPGVPIVLNLVQDGVGGRTVAYNGVGGMTITGPTTTVAAGVSAATCLTIVPTSQTAASVVINQQ